MTKIGKLYADGAFELANVVSHRCLGMLFWDITLPSMCRVAAATMLTQHTGHGGRLQHFGRRNVMRQLCTTSVHMANFTYANIVCEGRQSQWEKALLIGYPARCIVSHQGPLGVPVLAPSLCYDGHRSPTVIVGGGRAPACHPDCFYAAPYFLTTAATSPASFSTSV